MFTSFPIRLYLIKNNYVSHKTYKKYFAQTKTYCGHSYEYLLFSFQDTILCSWTEKIVLYTIQGPR